MATQRSTLQEAEQDLRAKGLQPTSQRVDILQMLREEGTHLSADELYVMLVKAGRKISRATVYNTLNTLKDHRLVNEIVIEPGRVLFDPNADPHYHFYDVDTRELMDVPAESVGIHCLPMLPAGAVFEGIDVVVKISRRS